MAIEKHNANSYTNAACRCPDCRAANTARVADQRARRAKRILEDPSLATHGSSSTYTNWGCRCMPCTEAHRLTRRAQREAAGT